METYALEARGLHQIYRARGKPTSAWMPWKHGVVHAVNDVNLALKAGRTMAVVGESGSGKSTLARLLTLLEKPHAGEIHIDGREISSLNKSELRALRHKVQIIFQDPYESLDPRYRIGAIVEEGLLNMGMSARERRDRVVQALAEVGLSPAERFIDERPHQLSGGQRQRVAIARAIVVEPSILIADEPSSMLDVSLRIGILKLLNRLQERQGIAIALITHDLAIARFASKDAVVMYGGRIVEHGPTDRILSNPEHPYTRLLLASTPQLAPGRQRQRIGQRDMVVS